MAALALDKLLLFYCVCSIDMSLIIKANEEVSPNGPSLFVLHIVSAIFLVSLFNRKD